MSAQTPRRKFMVALAALGLTMATAPSSLAAPSEPSTGEAVITLLGTAGGPPPHVDRSQPATLFEVDGHSYLIDAGENVGQQLVRANMPVAKVGTAFITHLHWDHTLGLGYLMATGWMRGRNTPMPIYGPPGLAKYVGLETKALDLGEAIFRPQTPYRPELATLYPVHVVSLAGPAEIYRDDAVTVTAVPNTHFSVVHAKPHSYGPDLSYSYRFDTRHGSVVFTGDTGPSVAVTQLAKGADILVSEICDLDSIRAALEKVQSPDRIQGLMRHMAEQHLSPEEVGKMAAAAGVKKLVLTHFVIGENFNPEDFVAKIRPYYKGEIIVGQDLASIKLGD